MFSLKGRQDRWQGARLGRDGGPDRREPTCLSGGRWLNGARWSGPRDRRRGGRSSGAAEGERREGSGGRGAAGRERREGSSGKGAAATTVVIMGMWSWGDVMPSPKRPLD